MAVGLRIELVLSPRWATIGQPRFLSSFFSSSFARHVCFVFWCMKFPGRCNIHSIAAAGYFRSWMAWEIVRCVCVMCVTYGQGISNWETEIERKEERDGERVGKWEKKNQSARIVAPSDILKLQCKLTFRNDGAYAPADGSEFFSTKKSEFSRENCWDFYQIWSWRPWWIYGEIRYIGDFCLLFKKKNSPLFPLSTVQQGVHETVISLDLQAQCMHCKSGVGEERWQKKTCAYTYYSLANWLRQSRKSGPPIHLYSISLVRTSLSNAYGYFTPCEIKFFNCLLVFRCSANAL